MNAMNIEDKIRPQGSMEHWVAHRLTQVSDDTTDDEWAIPSAVAGLSPEYQAVEEVAGTLFELSTRGVAEVRHVPGDPNMVQFRGKSALGVALKRLGTPDSEPDIVAHAEAFRQAAEKGYRHVGSDDHPEPTFVDPVADDNTRYVWTGSRFRSRTLSLEPDWEWLGVQLQRLGFPQAARDAFGGDLSPADVYRDWLPLITHVYRTHEDGDTLDLNRDEQAVHPAEEDIEHAKAVVGYDDGDEE